MLKALKPLTLVALVGPCLLAAGCGGGGSAGQAAGSATAQAAPSGNGGSFSPASRSRHTSKKTSQLAVRLMTRAAQATVVTSYHGEEVTTRWDTGGSTFLDAGIWHTSGGPTVTQTITSGAGPAAEPYVSADQEREHPEGVLGLTTMLVGLLAQHYVITYAGQSSADNRTAQVIEAWRADDSLAARFWLDSSTLLPLEREVYDQAGTHLISKGVFVQLQLGDAAGPAQSQRVQTWQTTLAPARLLSLTHAGWLVPRQLPGGLTLFAGSQASTPTGPVLDLTYSDGLYVVSVFEQHGKLAARLPGWQKTKVNGWVVYEAQPLQLTWPGKGTVYTLIADAPAPVVSQALRALPHDQPPGFWKRVSHGLARLVSLVNPFG